MIELLVVAFFVVVSSSVFVYRTLTFSYGSDYTDNSIDAFIIHGDDSSSISKLKKLDRYKRDYIVEGRQVLILYGTEYGCSEEIGRNLYDRISALNTDDVFPSFQPRLINMKDYEILDFSKEQVCFIIISTSGDGVPPSDAKDCYDVVMETDMSISHLKISLLALGDSNYPQFCKTGQTLYQRLAELGCETVVKQRDVDMEDWSVINSWLEDAIDYLRKTELPITMDYIQHGNITEDKYNRNKPFMATLKEKLLLTVCTEEDDKETIHCEFDLTGSDLTWTSGDALGIYPENSPEEVEVLLQTMKCDGNVFCERPSWAYDGQNSDLDDGLCLRQVLQKYYDMKRVKRELLENLHNSVIDKEERSRLEDILQLKGSNKNMVQTYIKEKEVADVLLDFPSHRLSWKQIIVCLKPLQPRYYSISSSPKLDKNTACVTAAVVRYEMAGRNRTGVTTTYLQDRLDVGEKCPVFISRNLDFRLPSDVNIPIILIGPGTGIAPFMAFIQERVLEAEFGQILLYFGCRHKDKDYLYESQLENWSKQKKIDLNVAFSRDQPEKIYVQHLLYRDRQKLWQLIDKDNASVYVCGDAKYMAGDVNTILIRIITELGHLTDTEAKLYLKGLEENRRYQKDVWVV